MDFQLSREKSRKTEEVFLVGSRESEGKSKSPPNREFSSRFGKEEMSTEDKRRRLRRLVPPWSFLTRQRFLLEKQKKMLCRTCKFAAVHRPLCSFPETPEASPMRGSCRRRRLMRWTTPRRRNCPHLIRHGPAVPSSPRRGRLFYAHSRQLYHFSYTQLSQIKYHVSNMANMTIMIWNFRAFFHVRSGLE